ncbi:hypothetical protein [Comamonas terrigena]|uniref:FDXHR family putative zinc-binding protein n=1 Tax=Comamonas terrigena TaxID=32013 RepID=UPI003C7CBFD0
MPLPKARLERVFLCPKTNMRPKLTLRGDRNQCPTCHLYFNSTTAFEAHRTGTYGVDRRCLTIPEMEAKGMVISKEGFWMTKSRPTESIPRYPCGATAADPGSNQATLRAH